MKKTLSIAAAALLSVGVLSACSTEPAPQSSEAPAESAARSEFSQELHDALPADIRDKGYISIAGETNQPWRIVDAEGKVSGLGEELWAELGTVLGVELRTELVTGLPAVKLGFQSGRNDAGSGPLLITDKTKEDVTFVEYLLGRPGIVAPAANKVDELLDICGNTIAILDGSAAWVAVLDEIDSRCADAGKDGTERLPLADINAAILAVESGRADFAGVGAHQSAYTAQNDPEKFTNYIAAEEEWKSDHLGMGFEVTDVDFATVIRDAWQIIFDNGVYADLMAEYGLEEIAVEEPVLHVGC